jgi:hypothetical protein
MTFLIKSFLQKELQALRIVDLPGNHPDPESEVKPSVAMPDLSKVTAARKGAIANEYWFLE